MRRLALSFAYRPEAAGRERQARAREAGIDFDGTKPRVKPDVAAATAKISSATPELTAAISQAVKEALASALGQEAESDIANRIAARVRDEALKVIGGGASA